MSMASIIQGGKKEVRKHKIGKVKWNGEHLLQVGTTAQIHQQKKVTSGSKWNRRGGLTKSKGTQKRFLDQMFLFNGCFPIFIF